MIISRLSGNVDKLAIAFVIVFMIAACNGKPSEETNLPTSQITPESTLIEGEKSTEETSKEISQSDEKVFQVQRQEMVDLIRAYGVENPEVLQAMENVPRHLFVPTAYRSSSYGDHPLPIGHGQTISQPFIVAHMTELLDLKPGEKVLEIGTGSGYQAAVLAELGFVDIYSIEIISELAESAAARLRELGYTNVQLKQGDGYFGWEEYAPFDAIIVTAAPDHLPAPLVAQLKDGGRIVIPIGPMGGFQVLWKFVNENGELKAFNQGGVSFVPLTGEGVESGQGVPIP